VASAFTEDSVVAAYQYRPPYPQSTFKLIADLAASHHCMLDVGCGTGLIARSLIDRFDQIDAIDISPAMLEQARRLPRGDAPNLDWIEGPVENTPLNPPYALITAGDSLHWMDWHTVLPRFVDLLTPNGYLVILTVKTLPVAWESGLLSVIKQYSTNQAYQPTNLIRELEQRHLFSVHGHTKTEPEPFSQSVEDYIESFHGRASFSRQRMSVTASAEFDQTIRTLLRETGRDAVQLSIVADVTWGIPLKLPSW